MISGNPLSISNQNILDCASFNKHCNDQNAKYLLCDIDSAV
jgi:hypothetical protein